MATFVTKHILIQARLLMTLGYLVKIIKKIILLENSALFIFNFAKLRESLELIFIIVSAKKAEG